MIPPPTYIGRSTVKMPDGHYYHEYSCHCGQLFLAKKGDVTKGSTKSCGCSRFQGRPHVDYVDKMVNYLKVTKEIGRDKYQVVIWEAYCTYKGCGRRIEVTSLMLHRGQLSCGCQQNDGIREHFLNLYRGIEL